MQGDVGCDDGSGCSDHWRFRSQPQKSLGSKEVLFRSQSEALAPLEAHLGSYSRAMLRATRWP